MGRLATPPGRDDPKRQVGAYIELNGRLYYVLGQRTGTVLTEVENCATGFVSHLALLDVAAARLVKAASELDVPDTVPDEAA